MMSPSMPTDYTPLKEAAASKAHHDHVDQVRSHLQVRLGREWTAYRSPTSDDSEWTVYALIRWHPAAELRRRRDILRVYFNQSIDTFASYQGYVIGEHIVRAANVHVGWGMGFVRGFDEPPSSVMEDAIEKWREAIRRNLEDDGCQKHPEFSGTGADRSGRRSSRSRGEKDADPTTKSEELETNASQSELFTQEAM